MHKIFYTYINRYNIINFKYCLIKSESSESPINLTLPSPVLNFAIFYIFLKYNFKKGSLTFEFFIIPFDKGREKKLP